MGLFVYGNAEKIHNQGQRRWGVYTSLVHLNNGPKVKCRNLKIRKKNSGLKEVVCVMHKI